ncbi:MAG: hypothetical protein AAGK09_07030 [Planctomycetota bacterium]
MANSIRLRSLASLAFVLAVAAAQASPVFAESRSARAERLVEARLAEPISVEFRDAPLDQVIGFVRASTGVNIDVRWRRLEEAGVARDAPVELILKNVPAGVILRRALQQVSTEFEPIDYAIEAGIVTTSTRDELGRRMVTRVYDVRGDLMPIRDFNDAPELDVNQLLSVTSDGAPGDLFEEADDEPDVPTRAERVQRLIDLIRTMILDRER